MVEAFLEVKTLAIIMVTNKNTNLIVEFINELLIQDLEGTVAIRAVELMPKEV